ncbi:hypothetical protein SGO26_30540 (plasmid) [Cupriavidus metallidurans]|mgnify:CR=1 FL=1|nr:MULTISPECIES: hypothetical protein [Cupriavidus]
MKKYAMEFYRRNSVVLLALAVTVASVVLTIGAAHLVHTFILT